MYQIFKFITPNKRSLQLGISTYSLPWAVGFAGSMPPKPATALDFIALANAHHIKRVQFGDNLPLHLLGHGVLKKLGAEALKSGITIEAGTRGLREENLLQYLSIAQQLSSPFLRVVIDDAGYEPDISSIQQIIQQVLPQFREAQVILSIENHDRFKAEVLKDIIEATDAKWVGICLDTANSLGANEGINEVLHTLLPYVVNVHIKDIRIQRIKTKMGFQVLGCAAGDGLIDIKKMIADVSRAGRCQSATLELWPPAQESHEATLAHEKDLFEKSISYLKNIGL